MGAGPVQGAQAEGPDYSRHRFNTYRFADHKERVIDLLKRVCAVSVRTVEIVEDMADWSDTDPDEGLEFRKEFVEEMQRRLSSEETAIPAEEVYRRLGLD